MLYVSNINDIMLWINDNIVWGIPLMALILIVGLVLTIRLRGIAFTKVGQSLKAMVKNDNGGSGEVSTFGALCISMAATLGTGKIIGVATAIQLGGPGALFWMIIAALLGMSTKYAEGFLAIKYRKTQSDGTIVGGPFAYIEGGLGPKFKWLAIAFAFFGAMAGVMGIGTMTQMNSINTSFTSVFDPDGIHVINIFGLNVSIYEIIITAIVTIFAAFAVLGGIERISKVSTILVPFMAVGYFLVSIAIIIFNITSIPQALLKIVNSAFSLKAGFGAASGIGIMIAMRQGISKGIFSNEAGLGSTPIAIASAKSNNPVEQGLVCMGTTFIDTMILCLTIGLGVVITGAYEIEGVEGINITINTFAIGLNINQLTSGIIVMLSITTFAFTTIIGWNVYGEKCVAYLSKGNKKCIFIYKIIYVISVAVTPFLTLEIIWTISQIFNGLMALPNLIALLLLSGAVVKETNKYFKNEKENRLNKNSD